MMHIVLAINAMGWAIVAGVVVLMAPKGKAKAKPEPKKRGRARPVILMKVMTNRRWH